MKSLPAFVWIVPAIILVVAIARLPYGYYTFARIVTCVTAVLIAVLGFKEPPVIQAASIPLILVAVLFNPFLPIHLARGTWFYLDLVAAGVFLAHLVLVRRSQL